MKRYCCLLITLIFWILAQHLIPTFQATAAAEKLKEERVKAYNEKKGKKPALIAKSSIILDVKPWDDETDMAEMEKLVRSLECDGLLWGVCKFSA